MDNPFIIVEIMTKKFYILMCCFNVLFQNCFVFKNFITLIAFKFHMHPFCMVFKLLLIFEKLFTFFTLEFTLRTALFSVFLLVIHNNYHHQKVKVLENLIMKPSQYLGWKPEPMILSRANTIHRSRTKYGWEPGEP